MARKLTLSLALTALLLGTFLLATPVQAEEWTVDTAHSNVGFSVRHFVSQVPGRFGDFSGTIVYDQENPENSTVELTVQTASIDTNNEQRDGHLRSPDFFNADKHPTLTFKSVKVTARDKTHLAVLGDLTMNGVTKRVTVPVEVLGSMMTPMGGKAGFAAEFTVNRKDFDIVWNRALDQGGTILGDEVSVRIDIEANLVEEKKEGAEG